MAKAKVIFRVPDRTVPHRPAKSTRRYLLTDTGVAKITPHPVMIEKLDEDLPSRLHECVTIFLNEHCIFNEKDYLWRTLQKGNLNAAISSAVKKILTHKERIHELFAASGGKTLVTAHLVAADFWDEAAKEICSSLDMEKYYDKLTTKIRPRGGMPMYDEAMRTLAEIVERGDWQW